MNQNEFDVCKYMIIHLLLFIFKNIIFKFLLKISNKSENENEKDELEIMKKKYESLKEQIREISPTSEYVKYINMERQINELNEKIKQKESINFYKNFNINFFNNSNDQNKNVLHKILNSYIFKFFMYFINIIEYFLLKNEYFEVEYENNKTNIIVNHYYNEEINKFYVFIPIYKILIAETIVLNSLFNMIQKLK